MEKVGFEFELNKIHVERGNDQICVVQMYMSLVTYK